VMLFTVSKGIQLYREMKIDAGWRSRLHPDLR